MFSKNNAHWLSLLSNPQYNYGWLSSQSSGSITVTTVFNQGHFELTSGFLSSPCFQKQQWPLRARISLLTNLKYSYGCLSGSSPGPITVTWGWVESPLPSIFFSQEYLALISDLSSLFFQKNQWSLDLRYKAYLFSPTHNIVMNALLDNHQAPPPSLRGGTRVFRFVYISNRGTLSVYKTPYPKLWSLD